MHRFADRSSISIALARRPYGHGWPITRGRETAIELRLLGRTECNDGENDDSDKRGRWCRG